MTDSSRYLPTMPIDAPTATSGASRKAVPRNRLRRAPFVAFAALVATALGVPAVANAADARYEGASADGSIVFFTTIDPLVTGDTDSRHDVFERSKDAAAGGEYVTRVVSVGPTGGNQAYDASYGGVSADGTRVFFSTKESLVPADTDQSSDVYVRDLDANTTALVSRGDASCAGAECGNGAVDASFVSGGIAAEGEKAFFATVEDLSPQDTDASSDIYMRNIDAGTTTLVSQGDSSCAGSGCGNGPSPAFFKQVSASGTKVFLSSAEGLVAGEGDGLIDIYERDLEAGATSLVSSTGTCPGVLNCNAVYGGASNDGSHVFFETNEQISGGDSDDSADVYDWAGATAVLASTEPDGGNGAANVTYAGNSADGAAVFFHTDERLDLAADGDNAQDVYRRSGGVTVLISTRPEGADEPLPASFKWVSPDGTSTAAIFTTTEPLIGADTDVKQDVYERSGSTTTLLSEGDPSCAGSGCGDGPYDADFARASADGSHVFFVTDEPLVEDEPLVKGDTDESTDVYQRFGGATTLISTGPLNGNGPFNARLHGASQNGSVAFFVTEERLTAEDDFAGEDDVYSRSPAGTLLVSVENDPELILGPAPPTLEGTSPASPGTSIEPTIFGQADAGTAIKIYTTPDCSGEQASDPSGEPAGGTAAQLATPGIAVTVAAGSTTSFYATAEAEGIVSGCSGPLAYTHTQESPPPPPPPPPGEGESSGSTGGGSVSTGTPVKTYSGGIAYVTPSTQITFGPAFKTRKRVAVFRFVDSTGQPGTSFFCKLDRRSWRSCSSPSKLKRLSPAKHVFRVKALNAVGTWEPQPVKHGFKVVR